MEQYNRYIFGPHFQAAQRAVDKQTADWIWMDHLMLHKVIQFGFSCLRKTLQGPIEPFAVNALYKSLYEEDFFYGSLKFLEREQNFSNAHEYFQIHNRLLDVK